MQRFPDQRVQVLFPVGIDTELPERPELGPGDVTPRIGKCPVEIENDIGEPHTCCLFVLDPAVALFYRFPRLPGLTTGVPAAQSGQAAG